MGKIRRLRNHGAMVLSSRLLWESHFSNIFSRKIGGLSGRTLVPRPLLETSKPPVFNTLLIQLSVRLLYIAHFSWLPSSDTDN